MIRNALFLFGICAAIFVFFLPSYLQMQELHSKNVAYDRQIRELSRENENLSEEKRRLEEDPNYLESFAREKFGIIRDDEVIYKIVPAGTMDGLGQKSKDVAVGTTAPKPQAKTASKGTAGSVKKAATKSSTGTKKTAVKKTSTSTKSTAGTQTVNKTVSKSE